MQKPDSKFAIAFRKASAKDLPAITKIFQTNLNQENEFDDARGYLKDALKSDDNRIVVATAPDGKIAGFMMTDFHSDSRNAINVDQLAVSASFRHHGIGTALLKQAEEIALKNKFRAVTLQVRADNDNARKLYEDVGYQKIGKHWWYYQDGTSAFEMKKTLVPDPPHGGWLPGFVKRWMGMTA